MTLSFEQLFEIDELIDSKGWSSKLNRNGKSIKDLSFELFELSRTKEEYNLIKHLLSNYFLCTDYDEYVFNISRHIESVFFGERVIIIPISDEKLKIKSGHSVAYDLTRFINEDVFSEIHVVESLDSFYTTLDDFSIIVVDDFVGTGSQFRSFSRKCSARYGVDFSNIYLYSIALMLRAHRRIRGFCYDAYSCLEFKRALSDDDELNMIMPSLDIYEKLEKLAIVGKTYRRGYLKSEALVTMKKTPNNTLPIFWCKLESGGASWPAIFPRS